MNKVPKNEYLCFDDVLLEPQYSEIQSRHNIEIMFTDIDDNLLQVGNQEMKLPIFASPMDTVVDASSAAIMSQEGITPILHRYCSIERQAADYYEATQNSATPVGIAIGVTGDYEERACELYDHGCRIFCLDVAHGHHYLMKDALKNMRDVFGNEIYLMAGNVATRTAFQDLVQWGANFVRCGIGGGSVCSTRIVTGHGIPTLQTILDCSHAENIDDGYIVADGGLRSSGDIVKAFAAGADAVMLGSMLSCHDESPGITKIHHGVPYKNYRGMASKDAQTDWRGYVSVTEGVNSWRPSQGKLKDTIRNIVAGMKSGCSYSGVERLTDLSTFANFVRVSANSVQESHPRMSNMIFD